MSLDHMIHPETQIGSLSALEQMIALGDIEGQVQAFLLSCKVDELSPATLRDYAQKLRALTHFCRGLEVAGTKDITASHVRLFLLKLQETNSPVSIHDYYRVVKRFFNWLVEEEMLEHSPMSSIRPPRMPRKIVQPFTMSQIADLLLLCDSSTFIGARNKAIVLTFLDTGLRLGELAGIHFIPESPVLFDLWPPVMLRCGYLAAPGTYSPFPPIDYADLKVVLQFLLLQDPELWQS